MKTDSTPAATGPDTGPDNKAAAIPPEIREDLTLGIDLGIGSCGWALIVGFPTDYHLVVPHWPATDPKGDETGPLRWSAESRPSKNIRRVGFPPTASFLLG